MITEITRLFSAWMRHPEHGVNAQAALVGRQRFVAPGSAEPAVVDPAPRLVTVFDDVDDADLVLELDPPEVPAFVVWVDSDADVNVLEKNYLRTGEPVIVAGAYITRDIPPIDAKRDGGYVLRGARRTFWRMNDQRLSLGYRVLNDIQILKVQTVSLQTVAGGVGKSQMWGLIYAAVYVADTAP